MPLIGRLPCNFSDMEINMTLLNENALSNLPNFKSNHASCYQPLKFKVCGESLLFAPKSVIVDGLVSYGGSTGKGFKLVKKAFGEFHERNHLFMQVPIHCYKKLCEVMPERHQEQLMGLCQTSTDKQTLLNHSFAFTTVRNLFTEETRDYFYNAIALNGKTADKPFIYFSDSCGAACHSQKQAALYNSLMEFIERQALLGSWLSKNYQFNINPALLSRMTPYKKLVKTLLDNGELVIVQNGNLLPAHTVIIFYFADCQNDRVQYSIGSSSGLTLAEALNSALEELYQCYSFLYNTESFVGLENKAGAGYHLAFQQCNRSNIKETIPFLNNVTAGIYDINTWAQIENLKEYHYDEVIAELKNLSSDIFYYHFFDESTKLHHTKVLSPDFFAHMALNDALNIDNTYAKKLGITKENAFLGKIPFP